MTWVWFSRVHPEEGADWLAYWRERGGPRPEVNFTVDADGTARAREMGPPNRRWSHPIESVHWTEEQSE